MNQDMEWKRKQNIWNEAISDDLVREFYTKYCGLRDYEDHCTWVCIDDSFQDFQNKLEIVVRFFFMLIFKEDDCCGMACSEGPRLKSILYTST